jgi:hypothetical protein
MNKVENQQEKIEGFVQTDVLVTARVAELFVRE